MPLLIALGDIVRHCYGGLPAGWTMTGVITGHGGDVRTSPGRS